MSSVNFTKLQNEFDKRLEEEFRARKQDEIRFQTMTDPRITYDQYSELLKGAHLKSIQKQEHAEINRRYKQTVSYTDFDQDTINSSTSDNKLERQISKKEQ